MALLHADARVPHPLDVDYLIYLVGWGIGDTLVGVALPISLSHVLPAYRTVSFSNFKKPLHICTLIALRHLKAVAAEN